MHKGIYSIFAKNLTSGVKETLVDVFPGGASRPILSRDGRTLAFVRRVRDKEALVLKYVISILFLISVFDCILETSKLVHCPTSGLA